MKTNVTASQEPDDVQGVAVVGMMSVELAGSPAAALTMAGRLQRTLADGPFNGSMSAQCLRVLLTPNLLPRRRLCLSVVGGNASRPSNRF